jgi:hypothetical protein
MAGKAASPVAGDAAAVAAADLASDRSMQRKHRKVRRANGHTRRTSPVPNVASVRRSGQSETQGRNRIVTGALERPPMKPARIDLSRPPAIAILGLPVRSRSVRLHPPKSEWRAKAKRSRRRLAGAGGSARRARTFLKADAAKASRCRRIQTPIKRCCGKGVACSQERPDAVHLASGHCDSVAPWSVTIHNLAQEWRALTISQYDACSGPSH